MQLLGELTIMRPKTEVRLASGEWQAIGSHFEVGMILQPDVYRTGYEADGELVIPGACVARRRGMPNTVQPKWRQAVEIFRDLRAEAAFPLRMVVQHSFVEHIYTSSGRDIIREVADVTNDPNVILSELAIGTNGQLEAASLDWSKNCQMNEGCLGIHAGVGNGLSGVHIDFVCPGVEITGTDPLP